MSKQGKDEQGQERRHILTMQLPISCPKTHVAFNQHDGQMAYHVDGVEASENPHVNYEPSSKTDSLS